MKLVLFGVIAFVLGIGGSTGALVLTAPKLAAGADSLLAMHADSLAKHGAPAAHGEAAHAAPADAHASPAAAVPAAVTPAGTPVEALPATAEPAVAGGATHGADATNASHSPAVETVRVPPPPAAGLVRAGTPVPDEETFKQVGTILMNMKPVEAAKIMSYLTDSQVEGLLRSMSPRNAATVLSQMTPERGAALSRRLLVPAPKESHL